MNLEIAIEDVFEHLLSTAFVRSGFAFLQHVLFETFQRHFVRFDVCADAAVPTLVAIGYELANDSVLADFRSDSQASSKRIHPANVGMEQVDGLETFSTNLGIEIDAASR